MILSEEYWPPANGSHSLNTSSSNTFCCNYRQDKRIICTRCHKVDVTMVNKRLLAGVRKGLRVQTTQICCLPFTNFAKCTHIPACTPVTPVFESNVFVNQGNRDVHMFTWISFYLINRIIIVVKEDTCINILLTFHP